MGGSSSKSTSGKDKVYAEIVTGKEEEHNVPPIKVILNAHLTSTAVDQLKDSEKMMHLLAENLVVDALKDKDTPKKFGEFLEYILAYDSTRQQTRELLYWSIKTPDCYQSIRSLSAWQLDNYLNTYGTQQAALGTKAWVLSPVARKTVICPLLTWTLRQQDIVVDPLATIIKDSLPYSRESVKEGLKYVITENLKSEGVKTAVKDAIIGHLSRIGKVKAPASVDTPPAASSGQIPGGITALEATADAHKQSSDKRPS